MSMPRWSVGLAFAALSLTLTACTSSTPAGGNANPTNVTVTAVGTVPWLAAQDGTGAWVLLSGSSFTVTDSAGKYGVAWVCTLGSGQNEVHVTQATTSDATSLTASCQAAPAPATGDISGTVSGIPSGGYVLISFGGQAALVYASSPTFSFHGVAAGPQTIAGFVADSNGYLVSDYVHRNVTVQSGSNPNLTVDLADTTYSTTTGLGTKDFSATGGPSNETVGIGLTYLTGAVTPNMLVKMGTFSSISYVFIPSSLAQPSDAYVFTADAHTTGFDSGSGGDDQQVFFVSQQPGPTTSLSIPGALPGTVGIGVSAGTATAAWGSASFSTSGGATAFFASVTPGAPSPIWTVSVSSAWLGSATSYRFPDFTSTSGWNASWNFPTGVTADAWVEAAHASLTFDQLLDVVKAGDLATGYPNGTSFELAQHLVVGGTY